MPGIKFILILLVCTILACGPSYDKQYYERISGIKIPASAAVLESVDNGEFMTVTTFSMPARDMAALTSKYGFKSVEGSQVPDFLGNSLLKGAKPAASDVKHCLINIQQKGKSTVIYVADTSQHLLWAEINYPDWSGN